MTGSHANKRSIHDYVCWSADVPDTAKLLDGLRTMPDLAVVKLDRLFVEREGFRVIDLVQEVWGRRVFDDAKIAEIPEKLEAVARVHLQHRPWMLNCQVGGALSSGIMKSPKKDELDGLKRFADACHEVGTRPCGVTVLTSKTPTIVHQEFNERSVIEQVLFYAHMMVMAGFTDIVCSPHEAQALRQESTFDSLTINAPGIRLAGDDTHDQARVDTPAGALRAGVDRLVIGRSLTKGDPAANYSRILDEIRGVLTASD